MNTKIRRELDDELTFAGNGKFSPHYIKGMRSRELVQFLKENPQVEKEQDGKLADAWSSRTLSAICDRELARVGLARK